VFLARENSTGKLVWVRADDGSNPPPDQIISKASKDGRIPEELVKKLRKAGGNDSPPVLIIGDSLKAMTECIDEKSTDGSVSSKSTKSSPPTESDFSSDSQYEKDRSPLKDLRGKSAMLCGEPPSILSAIPPLEPIDADEAPVKRRKLDISHKKLKKPKRPKTGYNYFQLSIRDKLCDKIPMDDRVLHNETVARIIGKKWKALSKQERKVFQNLAEEDKSRYERELKDYLQKMYELGADGRIAMPKSDRKRVQSRRCFSFDTALTSKKSSKSRKRKTLASSNSNKFLSSETPLPFSLPKASDQFLEEKSKLGQQISSAIGSLAAPRTDKWLDDVLTSHLGRDSRFRSSMSCDNLSLSTSFDAGLERALNDRRMFGDMREPGGFLDGLKAPAFGSLPNIESLFCKDFNAWE